MHAAACIMLLWSWRPKRIPCEIRGEAPEGKLLDFNTAGASRESWGQTSSTAEVAAHSHRGSGSYSTDFFSGSLCEPTLRPVVMLGPCLVVHLCLIQLQGGT